MFPRPTVLARAFLRLIQGVNNKNVDDIGLVLAEYALSLLTWTVLLVDFIVELNCYVKQRTWLVRFPILFVFAGEIAKLRCIISSLHLLLNSFSALCFRLIVLVACRRDKYVMHLVELCWVHESGKLLSWVLGCMQVCRHNGRGV